MAETETAAPPIDRLRFDLRGLIALTTTVAGILAIAREHAHFGACCASILVASVIVLHRLSSESVTRRVQVFLAALIPGLLGAIVAFVGPIIWFDILNNVDYHRSSVVWDVLIPVCAFFAALFGALAVAHPGWRKWLARFTSLLVLVGLICFAGALWRSKSERWYLGQHVDRMEAYSGTPIPTRHLTVEWLRTVAGTTYEQQAAILDSSTLKADYPRFLGLDRTEGLIIRDVDLSAQDLTQLSKMPSICSLVFQNSQLPKDALSNFNLDTLQFWNTDVNDTDLSQMLRQQNIDCVGLHEAHVCPTFFDSLKLLPKLQSLLFAKTDLSDRFDISSCLALEWIRLVDCNVTDEHIARLAKQEKKRTKKAMLPISGLVLHGNPISDACINDLISFTGLTMLDVTDTDLTTVGIKRLHAGLPATKIDPPR